MIGNYQGKILVVHYFIACIFGFCSLAQLSLGGGSGGNFKLLCFAAPRARFKFKYFMSLSSVLARFKDHT